MTTVCFVNPRSPMFVVVKASETPAVEDPLNTVLQGTQPISILVFTT